MKTTDFKRKGLDLYYRIAGHYRHCLPSRFIEPLRDAIALEIGGPSTVFGKSGLLPLYPELASVDGANFSIDTIWHNRFDSGVYKPDDSARGCMWTLEAADLHTLPSDTYDAILSAHVLEHLANPIKALLEWQRVLKPGGLLLVVVPHKEGTFDHRRPVTPLSHLVADFHADVREDDLTHLDEVIELHDLERDPTAGDRAALARRSQDNLSNRALHHHVFTTRSVLELLDWVGFELEAVEVRWPHDVYCLCRYLGTDARPDNSKCLSGNSVVMRRSPFRADREDARIRKA